jgi:hypothetical protein
VRGKVEAMRLPTRNSTSSRYLVGMQRQPTDLTGTKCLTLTARRALHAWLPWRVAGLEPNARSRFAGSTRWLPSCCVGARTARTAPLRLVGCTILAGG